MKLIQMGAGAAACGLLMVVLSFVWPTASTATSSYTDEDAQQFQETVARVHSNMGIEERAQQPPRMHGGEPVDPEKLAQQRADKELLAELQSKLESARGRSSALAAFLKWGGAGLVAVGASLIFIGRSREG